MRKVNVWNERWCKQWGLDSIEDCHWDLGEFFVLWNLFMILCAILRTIPFLNYFFPLYSTCFLFLYSWFLFIYFNYNTHTHIYIYIYIYKYYSAKIIGAYLCSNILETLCIKKNWNSETLTQPLNMNSSLFPWQ